jgi:hypothetical protein
MEAIQNNNVPQEYAREKKAWRKIYEYKTVITSGICNKIKTARHDIIKK